jgi:hypothetical protein
MKNQYDAMRVFYNFRIKIFHRMHGIISRSIEYAVQSPIRGEVFDKVHRVIGFDIWGDPTLDAAHEFTHDDYD